MGRAIGIDLGTTYSAVGIYDKNTRTVNIIANEQGDRTTPSYVAFTDTERLIGNPAKNQCAKNPLNTVFDAKRLIGRRFNDESVQSDMKHFPFNVVDKDGLPHIYVRYLGEKQTFRPEEISAFILTKMKNIAESYLNEEVTQAVITVPAYFNDSQRRATADAARIANLEPLRIINEPTAAALAYGYGEMGDKTKEDRTVLVFDLGGGTFDCTLLEIDCETGMLEVKSTNGNTHLGGEDFDNLLVDYCVQKIGKTPSKIDSLRKNARVMRRLRSACERAKRTLSTSTSATIEIDSLYDGEDFSHTITRAKFENMCHSLFTSLLNPVEKVLRDAKISKGDVDEIILVGGSTRIPKVQELLSQYFNGKQLNKSLHPDEAVAHGAAIQAHLITRTPEDEGPEMLLLDVVPLSLGLETAGGVMTNLINRNSTRPVQKSQVFSTYADNQPAITVKIFEGERKFTKDNHCLGTFNLEGIPPAPRGVPQIEITFDVDADGILTVKAVDKANSDNVKELTIDNAEHLSTEDVDEMIRRSEKMKLEDEERLKVVETHTNLEKLTYEIRNSINNPSLSSKMDPDDKQKLETLIKETIDWLETNTPDKTSLETYNDKRHELESLSNPIMTKLYADANAPEPPNFDYGHEAAPQKGPSVEEVD